MDSLFSIRQIADRWGVTYQRVQALVSDGDLSAERLGKNDRFVRIRESELLRFERERRIPGTLPDREGVTA